MPMPPAPRNRDDHPACVRGTLDAAAAEGKGRDEAVLTALAHCQLPGRRVVEISARRYTGRVQTPGIQQPVIEGLPGVDVDFTPEFYARLHERGFEGVPANLLHEGREGVVVVGQVAEHSFDGRDLYAAFDLDEETVLGPVVQALVEAGIEDGAPVQVSFEVDDLVFAEDPTVAHAAGRPVRPVDGRIGAVSILPGVEGACGEACAITLAACKDGGKCGTGCCGGPRLSLAASVEGAKQPETLKNPRPPSQTRSPMTPEDQIQAVQAEKDKLAAELETERTAREEADKAREEAEREVKELREKAKPEEADDPAPDDPDISERLASLEKAEADRAKADEAREEAERQGLVGDLKEAAPDDFEVDETAPKEVIAAQLRAFKAAKPAAPAKGGPPRIRLHAAKGEVPAGEEDQPEAAALRLMAERLPGKGGRMPRAILANGFTFEQDGDA